MEKERTFGMTESLISINPISAMVPLKVLIVAEQTKLPSDDRQPYFDAITRAFHGGTTLAPDGTEDYYASGEDLGVEVRRIVGTDFWKGDNSAPEITPIVASCGHLLVIVLLEGKTPANTPFGLSACAALPSGLHPTGCLP